jgi:hypothetical protein
MIEVEMTESEFLAFLSGISAEANRDSSGMSRKPARFKF